MNLPVRKSPVQFSQSDMAAFAAASGDRNPLHCSAEYAAKTAYGDPVVFGVLGAVACLSALEIPPGTEVATLNIEFERPMFCGVCYELVPFTESSDKISARILDGSTCLLTFSAALRTDNRGEAVPAEGNPVVRGPVFNRAEARPSDPTELAVGRQVGGQYRPDWAAANALRSRWPISPVKRPAFLALLFSSYLVGMELPGEAALFSRVFLKLSDACGDPALPLDFSARVASFDERMNKLRMVFEVAQETGLIAQGSAWAFARTPIPLLETAGMESWLSPSTVLAGRVALVIGSSRGLGAVVAVMLASQGCEVIANYRRSTGDAERLAACADALSGRISLARGDASDLQDCQELKRSVVSDYGRLDILVCNASPPIPALRLEENTLGRIQSHIHRALALVLTPMSVFLPLIECSEGTLVAISSIFVEEPVKEFPHYVAGKKAIEGLAGIAALQYPKIRVVVQRPPKILTALTNTPMGRRKAAPAEQVASQLVNYLCSNPQPGLHII